MSCIFRNNHVRVYETVDEERDLAAVVENLTDDNVTVLLKAYDALCEIQVTLEPDGWFGILRDMDGDRRIESIKNGGILTFVMVTTEIQKAIAA